MKMEFPLFLLAFTLFWELSSCIRCYKCEPEREYEEQAPLCSHFDYSEKFIVNCEYSTMCFKRETFLPTSYNLVNEEKTVNYQRGCAYQTMSGDQKKINGKWRPVNDIYEVYKDGCADDPSDVERATKTLHCYCRGDLCNGAPKITRNIVIVTLTLTRLAIFMFS